MSLAVRIRRGSRARLYRPVAGSELDASRSIRSWTLVDSRWPILLQPIGADAAGKVYGVSTVVTKQAWSLPGTAPAVGDRLVVVRGVDLARRYRIAKVLDWLHDSPNDHYELALESTEETFP